MKEKQRYSPGSQHEMQAQCQTMRGSHLCCLPLPPRFTSLSITFMHELKNINRLRVLHSLPVEAVLTGATDGRGRPPLATEC
jgi:hypothetical protein